MAPGTTCSPCAAKALGHECVVLPLDLPAIDRAIAHFAAHPGGIGDNSIDGICLAVLESVYPTNFDGRPLYWAALSDRDSWCLHVLYRRVHARVCAGVGP